MPEPGTDLPLLVVLARHRFDQTSEKRLQDGIELVMKTNNLPHQREVRLGKTDIIDFVVDGRMGIEVKIKGTLQQVTRQLFRYAQSGAVDRLVLVTTKAQHRRVPTVLGGKRVDVFLLQGGLT